MWSTAVTRRTVLQGAVGAVAGGWVRKVSAAPTSLRAIAVNHISYQSADYAKIRDFYADLLGMKVSHDDGRQCYLQFGNTFLIARTISGSNGKPPRIDHIGYTIQSWDKQAVELELTRRGLKFKPDAQGAPSVHVSDLDGYDLQICGEEMKPSYWPEMRSKDAPARKNSTAPGAFTAITVNHISYQAADAAKTLEFYGSLLDMKVLPNLTAAGVKQQWLQFGNSYIIPRTSTRSEMKPPLVDHIAYTIANWDKNAVERELKRRGLDPRPDLDTSFIVRDPEGFTLQISGEEMKPNLKS